MKKLVLASKTANHPGLAYKINAKIKLKIKSKIMRIRVSLTSNGMSFINR